MYRVYANYFRNANDACQDSTVQMELGYGHADQVQLRRLSGVLPRYRRPSCGSNKPTLPPVLDVSRSFRAATGGLIVRLADYGMNAEMAWMLCSSPSPRSQYGFTRIASDRTSLG